ncbi:2Fe-2S iron-sulfur cluster-binding protein [Flavobacterium polysaccharolyticum]|uniref:2Fe-2S iron-sulfur cluster-binding protein n=1 Tax=Flavobacterium polysaccharolyticum TaxID=3133148 RepID=A0ABU9NM52_9FLAO|nr:2Fe-2S iron-sulfur cluster-binding protein [uncultured Flavobacterium sp.]
MIENKIHIKVFFNNEVHNIITYKNEYRNLMQLLADRLVLDDFGECKGEGKCGTCMILAINKSYSKSDYYRNELNTLSKFKNERDNLRLSCQLLINEEIQGLHLEITEAI